jgi:trehalose/maltose transport system substrate-binding protein
LLIPNVTQVVKAASGNALDQRAESCNPTRRSTWFALHCSNPLVIVGILLSGSLLSSCNKPAQPVTITFLDQENQGVPGDHRMISDVLQDFTRETGILVNDLPTPEGSTAKIDLTMDLLRSRAAAPDVYSVDTIWAGIMGDYLVDLQPYFASDIASQDRGLIDSYMVKGKLVAMPYNPNVQVLVYRTDLISEYGYKTPPRTWDELEKMSVRIQAGERAKGKKDFWGFVWAGTTQDAGEALIGEGLQWQAAEGGGHIIEPDGRISVNNPAVIRAWERAAHWLGWISPPSVVSYTTTDAEDKFWVTGRAAFQMEWALTYEFGVLDKPFRDKAGVTSVPAGKNARVAELGAYSLGVSRTSAHRAEAVRLIQYLIRRQAQSKALPHVETPGRKVEYFEVPQEMNHIYPWWCKPGDTGGSIGVSRPAVVAGANYEAVSKAYAQALHSVLARQSTASAAVAALENEIARIMGPGGPH